jgi:dihydropteroate synthase
MRKGRHIDIMGIVNITDDSYFAESRCADVPAVMARVSRMMEEGADIIDIGACSTRPGSLPVGAEQEWRRLEPVLEAVKETFPHARLSIDTYWSSVVSRAYDLIGDFIVNDISAGAADEGMLPVTGALGLTYVAMHMRGTPENMQSLTDYADVTEDVVRYFCDFSVKAADNGIKDWILDPGFGFAKNIQQNYTLLNELNRLRQVSRADGLTPKILVGVSRKSMIYKLLGISPEDSLPATQVLHFAAMQNGADILRVHDVAEAVRTRDLYNMVALSQFAK